MNRNIKKYMWGTGVVLSRLASMFFMFWLIVAISILSVWVGLLCLGLSLSFQALEYMCLDKGRKLE